MKSSFNWPGRPPAEMISRNVKRLLTSTLDGTPKRGAFCASTLDGTPKRGAFCTSTLDGTPKRGAFCTSYLVATLKRGAFCTSYLVATLKRDAFLCTRVGAYCIRPTKRSRKGTGSAKGGQTCDFLSPTGPFSGAYLSTPYHATSKRDAFYTSYLVATLKRGAFCTSYLVATLKRGAFWTSYLVATLKRGAFCTSYLVATLKRGAFCTSTLDGRLKRDAFLCTRVGAYCIRPTFLTIKINGTQIRSTKHPYKGTRSAKGDQTCDSLSPTGPFGGAYLGTPYHATSKRDAFYTSYLLATLKRGAFCTSYLVATLKRGAFYTSILDGRLKRDAFSCTRVGAYCIRLTFLTIMVECMQIRSTKHPCKRTGSAKGGQTCDSLSPTGPFSGAYAIRPYYGTPKR